MTMRVTMLQSRYGAGGALLAAGSTYSVSDEFGAALVGWGFATDTDGVLSAPRKGRQPLYVDPATGVVSDQDGNASSVSGAGNLDLLVYGANPGGLMAAIAAARRGAKVLVLQPDSWIGGMLTGGINATDINKGDYSGQVNGLAREFWVGVAAELGQREEVFWRNGYAAEPRFNQIVLGRMLGEAGVTVLTGVTLTGVSKSGTRITSISTTSGTYSARTYVDGTYEGDLIAAAGCTVSIGRESSALYGESYAGIRPAGNSVQFDPSVSPYVVAGNPGSGLLPGVMSEAIGTNGAASPYVMGFNFRLCVAKTGANKIAMPEPSYYDPLDYELLGRHIAAVGSGWTTLDAQALALQLQNRSGLSNAWDWNNGSYPIGVNFIDPMCTEYLTATPERRAIIKQRVKDHVLGFFKFMRTDSRVPAAVRADAATWGLLSDQYEAYGGFSPQLYVREGRRLVGDVVGRQDDMLNAQTHADGVATAYYSLDSHHVRRVNDAGIVKNEGYLYGVAIYGNGNPVRFAWMKPKAAECTNLLATFAISVSRVAFLSLRMEPISMGLGEAAGIAAVIAAQRGIDVANVSAAEVVTLQDRFKLLTPGGAILSQDDAAPFNQGTVTNNGTWTAAAAGICYGLPAHAASTAAGAYKRFAPDLGASGAYDVFLYYPVRDTSARSTATPVSVVHAGGTTNLTLDQNVGKDGGNWVCIGRYTMARGAPSAHYVQVGTDGTNSSVIGAAKFVPAAPN